MLHSIDKTAINGGQSVPEPVDFRQRDDRCRSGIQHGLTPFRKPPFPEMTSRRRLGGGCVEGMSIIGENEPVSTGDKEEDVGMLVRASGVDKRGEGEEGEEEENRAKHTALRHGCQADLCKRKVMVGYS